jgi:hypothetical protein
VQSEAGDPGCCGPGIANFHSADGCLSPFLHLPQLLVTFRVIFRYEPHQRRPSV